jgi:hypothetical protein
MPYAYCEDAVNSRSSWDYNWGAYPTLCQSTESIPMLWGEAMLTPHVGGNSSWVMGFNEPDLREQANLSPERAAELWRKVEAWYPNRKLVAPVPSSGNRTWLPQFRQAYIAEYAHAPRLDALAMHCYYQTASECIQLAQWFEDRLAEWHVPELWVTEFAVFPCSNLSLDQAAHELKTFIDWMETQSPITRYAYFANRYTGAEWWMGGAVTNGCIAPLYEFSTGVKTYFGNVYVLY